MKNGTGWRHSLGRHSTRVAQQAELALLRGPICTAETATLQPPSCRCSGPPQQHPPGGRRAASHARGWQGRQRRWRRTGRAVHPPLPPPAPPCMPRQWGGRGAAWAAAGGSTHFVPVPPGARFGSWRSSCMIAGAAAASSQVQQLHGRRCSSPGHQQRCRKARGLLQRGAAGGALRLRRCTHHAGPPLRCAAGAADGHKGLQAWGRVAGQEGTILCKGCGAGSGAASGGSTCQPTHPSRPPGSFTCCVRQPATIGAFASGREGQTSGDGTQRGAGVREGPAPCDLDAAVCEVTRWR